MAVKVVLVDINPRMVKAWRASFEENPEVEIEQGSMLDQEVDAWITPTNARASMDGGLDGVIKGHFGPAIERRVQAEIRRLHGGLLPVGHATCVPTGSASPAFLISTPTMVASSEDISDTLKSACPPARRRSRPCTCRTPASRGASARSPCPPSPRTGRVPVETCAGSLMWTGYSLFRRRAFDDFAAMRAALEEELGDLGPSSTFVKTKVTIVGAAVPSAAGPVPTPAPKAAPTVPSVKKEDIDFDDF